MDKDDKKLQTDLKETKSNSFELSNDITVMKPDEKKKNELEINEKKVEPQVINHSDVEIKKSTNKVISQGKRIADAKAIQDLNKTILEKENNNVSVKNTNKTKNIGKFIIGILLSVVILIYFVGFLYFSNHFYKDVAINGINVSNMDIQSAKTTLEKFYTDYYLTIQTIDNKEEKIYANQIEMTIHLNDNFNSCIKQQSPYLWFVNMFKHSDIQVGAMVKWNDHLLSTALNEMDILNKNKMIKPVNAHIGVQDGRFAIIKQVDGNTINQNNFITAVKDSLSSVQTILNLKSEGCYNLPKIYESDPSLIEELKGKNKYANNDMKLKMDDFTLDLGMDVYSAVLEKKNNQYEISEKLVKDYIKKISDQYDTFNKERVFTTSFGDKQVKISGNAFGYKMNQEETAKKLYEALKNNKSATVDAVYDKKGYTLNGENDIGQTYIEVNLSEQKVIGYKNGRKITEGDCVSGNEAKGQGTSIGLFAIQNKLSPTVLRGEKKPVTKTIKKKKKGKVVKVKKTTYEYEYESPVTFWMQFNGGIGLHDAVQWRSSYGGSIYYYNGSHGCVNLPYGLAKELYENFEVGDPVVVYFWDNENRK